MWCCVCPKRHHKFNVPTNITIVNKKQSDKLCGTHYARLNEFKKKEGIRNDPVRIRFVRNRRCFFFERVIEEQTPPLDEDQTPIAIEDESEEQIIHTNCCFLCKLAFTHDMDKMSHIMSHFASIEQHIRKWSIFQQAAIIERNGPTVRSKILRSPCLLDVVGGKYDHYVNLYDNYFGLKPIINDFKDEQSYSANSYWSLHQKFFEYLSRVADLFDGQGYTVTGTYYHIYAHQQLSKQLEGADEEQAKIMKNNWKQNHPHILIENLMSHTFDDIWISGSANQGSYLHQDYKNEEIDGHRSLHACHLVLSGIKVFYTKQVDHYHEDQCIQLHRRLIRYMKGPPNENEHQSLMNEGVKLYFVKPGLYYM